MNTRLTEHTLSETRDVVLLRSDRNAESKVVDRYGQLAGHIAGIPCILEDYSGQPHIGETWLVKITRTNAYRTMLYVEAIRPWQDTPDDNHAVTHVHLDFHDGTVKFLSRFVFPMEHSIYAQLWESYKLLADNMNAVIIKGNNKAIRWNKKGAPPQVPLHRFATKYKNQPLLGDHNDINYFLANLDKLRQKTIAEARNKGVKASDIHHE